MFVKTVRICVAMLSCFCALTPEALGQTKTGHERAMVHPARVTGEGQRVAYDWDGVLQEWYVNDTRGLEHGYTVLNGQSWNFQAWHRDAGAGPDCNNNFTDAVEVTFVP
jgi:hypothetical protein